MMTFSAAMLRISLFSAGLWAFACQAQVYAVFGHQNEKAFDRRQFGVADISPDLPACKRNDEAWWNQVQRYEQMWKDPRRLSDSSWRAERWRDTLPNVDDWPRKLRVPPSPARSASVPQFGPAQGLTWLDIDSDGWCDALLSTDHEAAQRPGLPIILTSLSSALFFDPTSGTFKEGRRGAYAFSRRSGEITSAFTFYYNRKARRVETVERIFSSGMLYSSMGWQELHGRLMLKGAQLTDPLCQQAGSESDACAAHTAMNEEFGRVLDDLSELDPRTAAIRKRLQDLAAAPTKSPR